MAEAKQDFSRVGFFKTFVLPGAFVFLIPVISLFFFLHAQGRFDGQVGEQIRNDADMSPEEREKALAFFAAHPISELVQDPATADRMGIDSTTRFYYATFRWMIRLALLSIVGGVAVLGFGGACVIASRWSQRAQYLSLTAGWQILRLYGAFQVLVQGAMAVALSFWVTALWFHMYSVKLIGIAAILALVGGFAVIKAIFKRPDNDLHVEGKVLDRAGSPRLWRELEAICQKVGTKPPDNVIVGIDDNFFVTEAPVHVGETVLKGRSLFASLGLLKQMSGGEADAVLAHEMAHFSGSDTLYSRKIAPLLARYGNYLQALHENPLAMPVYAFMNAFRALFELSLGEHSRGGEFRADRIAAETTTPRDLASALLRVSAYSDFRGRIQKELFGHERALEAADISARLEAGFHDHARAFAAKPDLDRLSTSHPFDSHPPMSGRLEALGLPLASADVPALLEAPGDGRWYSAIDDAEEIERAQWQKYEEAFRAVHERSLPFRMLPETDEEREIVMRAFPDVEIEGKKGNLALRCDAMHYSAWPHELPLSQVISMSLDDNVLKVSHNRGGSGTLSIPMKTFGPRQAEALQAVQAYYGRYLSAVAYREQKREEAKAEAPPADDTTPPEA